MKHILLLLSLLAVPIVLHPEKTQSVQEIFIDSLTRQSRVLDSNEYDNLESIFTQNFQDICLCNINSLGTIFKHTLIDTKRTLSLLKDQKNKILGFVTYELNYPAPGSAYVELLAIDKNQQKKGYGSILLDHVTDLAKQSGCESITLSAKSKTLDFYKKNGFAQTHSFNYSYNYDHNLRRTVQIHELQKLV